MSKLNRTTKAGSKNKQTNIIIASLIVISVISLVALILVRHYKRGQETRRFANLEQRMSALSGTIKQQLGKPSAQEAKNYCQRESRKYEEGRLFCGTQVGLNYIANNIEQAQKIRSTIEGILSGNGYIPKNSSVDNVTLEDNFLNSYKRYKLDNFECFVQVGYNPAVQTGSVIGEPTPNTLGLIISCTDFASKQYYPIN